MDPISIFTTFMPKILSGGPSAVIGALLLVIALLLHDRKQLNETIRRKDDRIDKIIDDYNKGNITLADALNSLKQVLFEVKGRLG